MRTEVELQTEYLSERMGLVLNQDSSLMPGSSRSSSSGNSSDSSYSSIDRSRSPSVSRRSRGRRRHGSRYSSSSENSSHSRSRSRPRCCRALYHSRCRSHSHSPYPRRRHSRSISRSSSRERYYRRSRRSRSSYRRTRDSYTGRSRRRFSPLRTTRHHGSKSRSPERSVRLSQKDRTDLLNIAKENAEKSLGVAMVKLPASVRYTEGQMKKTLESETEKMPRAESALLEKPPQDEDEAGEGFEICTSPGRKPVSFSFSDSVAKPSSIRVLHVTEGKGTSRASSTGNTSPYGKWIPVKTASKKKKKSADPLVLEFLSAV